MATRKQRRKRQKDLRHDYEIVYLDSEGNEVERPPDEGKPGKPPAESPGRLGRRGQAQPPSWRRTLRRGLLFAPIFLVTVWLINGGRGGLAYAVFNALLLLAIFIPFSYFMDRLIWRSYQKRLARSGGDTLPRKR